MKIEFSSPITAADAGRRIIAGRIVTFGEIGHTSAGPTVFEPGSITFGEDIHLMFEHDTTRPLGRALQLNETPEGIEGEFKIASTSAGNDALVEAADGLRPAFSVGVDVTDHRIEADGTLVVTASILDHVGHVCRPAISSARIDRVAASENPTEKEPEMTDPEIIEVVETEETVEAVVEASRPVTTITAARTTARPLFASAGDFARAIVLAERGDRDMARRVEAAITPAGTADAVGIVPAAYTQQIVDHVADIRPLQSNLRNVAMTSTGMKIVKPKWGTTANGGWTTAENAAVATNKPTVVNYEVDVQQWAFAFGASVALIERSDPSYVDAVYAGAIKDYHNDVETTIATELLAITNTVASGADHLKSLGAAAAKVYTDVKQAPNKAFIAPDVWADLVSSQGTLLIGSGNGSLGSVSGNLLGLDLVVSPTLTAGSIIVGVSSAYEIRESSSIRLSANLIGTMTVEFGVTSFASFDLEDAKAFVKVSAAAPASK
jgi:HK97 family phage major capsid protein